MFKKVAALFVLSIMIVACGEDSSSDSSGSAPQATEGGGEVETLKLIIQPLVDYSPLYIGVEQGFFEEEGIDLQMDLSQGGAAAIPAVMSGEAHLGGSNVVSLMTARSKGLDIVAVAPGVKADKEYSAVIVPADSPIKSPADLAGKTLAVNTLKNIGEVTIRAALDGQVDVDTIQFTELGFGEMLPALEQGQIDAAWVVQPFVTQGVEAGTRVISYNFEETSPELQVGLMFASGSFAQENPKLLQRFQRAYSRSVTYATENEVEVRQVLPSFAGIEDSVAEAMSLPIWPTEIDRESVASTGELMVKYGVIPEAIDLDAFFS